jgi:hypothetical protein
MASTTEANVATAEPRVALMEGFEIRRMRGSIQSAGTGDVSSTNQMKFFEWGEQLMQHTQMVARVYVPDQNVDISVFHDADQMKAKTAMAEEINDRLGQLLKAKVTPQTVRRSPLQAQHAASIFMVDVTVVNQATKANANFQHAMRGLTQSGGSLRTLTGAMVDNWETLATTASHSGAPRMLFTLEPRSNANMENIAHCVEHYAAATYPHSEGVVQPGRGGIAAEGLDAK